MGRTILVDEQVQKYLEKLSSLGSWHIGLLIGQFGTQKNYVLHAAVTPDPVEDEVSDMEQETPAPKKTSSKPKSLEELNDQWLATHAKQVTRMLPGGLDVLGVFAVAPLQMLTRSEQKLTHMLFAIQKLLIKAQLIFTKQFPLLNDRVIFQMCSVTKKYTCRTLDISSLTRNLQPADWKCQHVADNWIKLETTMAIDLPICITKDMKNNNFIKKILTGIQPFCDNVWNGVAIVGNQLRKTDEALCTRPACDNQKIKLENKSLNLKTYKVNLLLPHENTESSATLTECSSSLWIRGVMKTCAYVYPKATVQEGIQAVKCDIIRSLISRCELLCEDIDVIEEDAATKTVFDTPVRVFGTLPHRPFQFCDYMFQDEQIEETINRFQELLDVALTEHCLQLHCERIPVDDDIEKKRQTTTPQSIANVPVYLAKPSAAKYYMSAVVAAVVAATASLSFFFYDKV
ncbi:protein odr-4 homolog [Argonauta hians]